jgi:hypothetical protein
MLSTVITNTSGATMAAGSLPGILSWIGEILNSNSVTVTLTTNDLKSDSTRMGLSLGDQLQQMVQKGLITVAFTNIGLTDRDVVSNSASASTRVVDEVYNTSTGANPTTKTHTLAYLPIPGTVAVTCHQYKTATTENPVMVPAENGAALSFNTILAHHPLTNTTMTIGWDEAGAKTTTLAGTTTVAGGDAANITSASIDRTTGYLVIYFDPAHPPTTDSIRVTYNYVGASATITDNGAGIWATALAVSSATINYASKACTITWTGTVDTVPYDGDVITVSYNRLN